MSAVAPVALQRALPVEEAARGHFYALLARLLHGAPDAALLARLAAAEPLPAEGDAALAAAWRGLVDASSVMDADAATEEYEMLFDGMGKSVVSIYAGYYGVAPAVEHARVRILAELARLGLGRPQAVTEPEDHYAGLLEVMRVLVAGGAGRSAAPIADQRRFFETFLEPGAGRFFAAVGAAPGANYYRHVAALGSAFTALESESFQLD